MMHHLVPLTVLQQLLQWLACLDQVVTRKLNVDEEHKCQLEQHVVMLAALCVYKIDGTATYYHLIIFFNNHIVDSYPPLWGCSVG
jgi:hypothetical protein